MPRSYGKVKSLMNKKARVLYILSVIFISIGIAGFVIGLLVQNFVDSRIGGIISGFASMFETAALVLIIVRAIRFGFVPVDEPEVVVRKVRTVDVKPVKETQEQRLFKRYEELYKEGLITKEDLENKRKELLG